MPCKKKSFKSFRTAEKKAIEISLSNKTIGHNNLMPYKCKNCGKWHLTSRSGMTNAQKDAMQRERDFIFQEARFWNSRLNNSKNIKNLGLIRLT